MFTDRNIFGAGGRIRTLSVYVLLYFAVSRGGEYEKKYEKIEKNTKKNTKK